MLMRRAIAALAVVGLLFTQQADAAYYAFAGNAFTFSQAGTVQVPNVVGEASEAAADAILEAALLDTGDVTAGCSSEPVNEVIAQDPAFGTFVAEASTVDLVLSSGLACWSLAGIPVGWYSIANAMDDRDFVQLMRQEANGDAVWAYWQPGTVIRASSQLRLNIAAIQAEADTAAVWARWSPGTNIRNTGNLQLNMQEALTVDFQ